MSSSIWTVRLCGSPRRTRRSRTVRLWRRRSCRMWRRWSKRLAGCIAIEAAAAAVGLAAGFQAGIGEAPSSRAVAIQDSRSTYAVIAQTDFRITQAMADFVAAQVIGAHDLDRPALLLHWGGIANRPPHPEELVRAIEAALGSLAPATVRYGHRTLSVMGEG